MDPSNKIIIINKMIFKVRMKNPHNNLKIISNNHYLPQLMKN